MKIYAFFLAFAVASFAKDPTATSQATDSTQPTAVEPSATSATSDTLEDLPPIPGPGPAIITDFTLKEMATTATESRYPVTTETAPTEELSESWYEELFTIRVDPDHKRLVTEDEMWHYKEIGTSFMDITNVQDLDSKSRSRQERKPTPFPTKVSHVRIVEKMSQYLSKGVMQTNIDVLSSFHNRYYDSEHGQRSSEWLLTQVDRIVQASGANNITVQSVPHLFLQKSIIVTIPGITDRKVILGAHLDSVNLTDRVGGRAPGADDNASGTAVLLETLRALLTNDVITTGDAPNTIEFHWYAGEEAGLLGSLEIFMDYFMANSDVKAMLNFDMIGFTNKSADPNKPATIGLGVDSSSISLPLSDFVKMLISNYTVATVSPISCGYACSDHASAAMAGYHAAFVSKASIEDTNPSIHTAFDNLTMVDMESVLEHARLALAFAYEMGMYDFDADEVGWATDREESSVMNETQIDSQLLPEAYPVSAVESESDSTSSAGSVSARETDFGTLNYFRRS